MPQPKKAGSARRSQARAKPGPKPGQTTNKDGSPRKKPGPKPGTPRGTRSTSARRGKATAAKATAPARAAAPAKRTNAKRGSRPKKTFLLYAVEGTELSFLVESAGATGEIAVVNAVKEGSIQAGTPVLPLPTNTITRQFTVEPEEREPKYNVKRVNAKATRKRTPKPVPTQVPGESAPPPATEPTVPAESTAPAPAAPAATSARSSARRGRASAPRPATPAPASGNPFAE